MAGQEVADLQAMTDVLREHRPGDVVVIEWLRNGQPMSAEATLGRRQ
jgi:S1-C subfamily serine protease